jgi:serine/threonine-protein kinase HipA
MSEDLDVALDLGGETVNVGVARMHRRRGNITTDFTYDPAYLANPDAYAIDPALHLDVGRGVVDGLPGAFADCAPDRWGRRLVTKRIQATHQKGQTPPDISDIDFLLGVSDLTRQGALRFRRRGDVEFSHPDIDVLKVLRLPELMRAADTVAQGADSSFAAVKVLLDAGSGSLGGARPKASVVDDGHLYIAKFPHHADEWDVMAWEKTALDLAERAGIEVPRRLITTVDGSTVLLLERFDRANRRRLGYMSALTMVQGRNGDDNRDYIELAAELSDVSAAADDDLAALWRRVAFSVAIHNTDDHLRNHGFLRADGGWRLSPAFDVNPNPDVAKQRVTSIGGATSRADELDALMIHAPDFGLTEASAASILSEVNVATRDWRTAASANGIPETAQNRFAETFEGLRDEMERSSAIQSKP